MTDLIEMVFVAGIICWAIVLVCVLYKRDYEHKYPARWPSKARIYPVRHLRPPKRPQALRRRCRAAQAKLVRKVMS